MAIACIASIDFFSIFGLIFVYFISDFHRTTAHTQDTGSNQFYAVYSTQIDYMITAYIGFVYVDTMYIVYIYFSCILCWICSYRMMYGIFANLRASHFYFIEIRIHDSNDEVVLWFVCETVSQLINSIKRCHVSPPQLTWQ